MKKVKFENKDGSISEIDLLIPVKRQEYKKGEFVVMNKAFAELLISDKCSELTGVDFRVLMCLIKRADSENRIKNFKQKNIADELKTRQPHISRSIKKLTSLEIIELRDLDMYFNIEYIYTGKSNK
jgi:hypothetical protein